MAGQTPRPTDELQDDGCYVGLTDAHLDPLAIMDRVRSPKAGAIVLFAGTTRDNFDGKAVKELQYSAYNPLALRTMLGIARAVKAEHALQGVALVHRLGTVPVGEESILIAVSAPHRQAGWRAAEALLEEVKAKVEVWKREEFEGDEGVWRANRDGAVGVREEPGALGLALEEEASMGPNGPIVRPRRLGELGHGPVVHP